MPIAGFSRFRQWAFSAAQSAHGTAGTPSGAFPWRGTPTVDPNWTDIDNVDLGSIDPILDPYRTSLDTTATLAGPLDFDSIPIIMAGGVKGGVTATGGPAYTWAHQAVSLTATTLDEFSAQWGDDYANDDFRFKDGIVESIELSFDENLGPWQVSTQWYFGSASPNVTRVAGLTIGSNLPLVFGADTTLSINSTSATIGNTLISNSLHKANVKITNTIDKKRFANGSNSRFAVAGYGLAGRTIEASFTFAKVDAIVGLTTSELRNFLNSTAITRYLELVVTSPQIITGSTPYSWSQRFAGTWRTKGDAELGGNSTVTLMLKGKYAADLGYAYRSSVVNSNPSLP